MSDKTPSLAEVGTIYTLKFRACLRCRLDTLVAQYSSGDTLYWEGTHYGLPTVVREIEALAQDLPHNTYAFKHHT